MALPSWVPEIETKPAPMPLLLVQSFVNTWEGDTGIDLLEDLPTATRWLNEAGLVAGSFEDRDLVEARVLREAIRALLVRNAHRDAPDNAERSAVSALALGSRYRPVVTPGGGIELEPEPGTGSLPATLFLLIRDAQRDGTWARLKACRNPDCQWAYYDRSHAGRGAWCDMAVCGNRIKNRNLRSRRSAGTSGHPPG
ncbi:MAG TPA: CGNR zinc finger domain-containing protein [Acidimicrobiales bacterium]|nr:CGNR zinc finger domain-containing protein [Acidimicrobiales bacterium]